MVSGWGLISSFKNSKQVLTLLILENGLGDPSPNRIGIGQVVLTLLILENGFGVDNMLSRMEAAFDSHNPSYTGKWFRGTVPKQDRSAGVMCLNPSYTVKWSRGGLKSFECKIIELS